MFCYEVIVSGSDRGVDNDIFAVRDLKTHWTHLRKKVHREIRTCSILSELIIPKSIESFPILISFFLDCGGLEL